MAGGLLQLVAYGSQDLYLTGNPQITFFKVVYRRHTNFAIESRRLDFTGTPNFSTTNTCNILKGPDLLHKMYLDLRIDCGKMTCDSTSDLKAFRWLNWLGHVLLKKVTFFIGGSEIDRHDGEWLHIWNELTQKSEKSAAYSEMVGNVPLYTQIHTTNKTGTAYNIFDGTTDSFFIDLHIPLEFWFTKNPGLSIPLVALNHADLTLEVEFRGIEDCIWATHESSTNFRESVGAGIFSTIPAFSEAKIYADYIFLDTDERKRFAQSAHEYLIEKIQIGSVVSSISQSQFTYNMNWTHPVKELIFVIRDQKYIDNNYTQSRCGKQWYNYSTEFDYTGFTGTPEPHTGNGMCGHRTNQNLWNGMPSISLPYIENEFTPDLGETAADNSSTKWLAGQTYTTSVATSNSNKTKMGYDRVKAYHTDTSGSGTLDNYSSRNVDRFLGATSAVQHNSYTVTVATGMTIPAPYHGSWGASGTRMRMLDQGKNPVNKAKIIINSVDRAAERNGFYYNTIQPYQHHTNVPALGINVYSFGFTPEDHQPSGTCNFSRIDNSSIQVTLDSAMHTDVTRTAQMKVYAVSYNILRIMSGTGQIAYSN